MRNVLCPRSARFGFALAITLALVAACAFPAMAQEYTPPPPPPPPAANQVAPAPPPPGPPLSAGQLDHLVARIALYPDPLLAQVLTASTYWTEVPEAAAWANQHQYEKGDRLAEEIREDNLQWNPAVVALAPFPSVLNMMAQDPAWTQELGSAVLSDRGAVMDAIQRLRREAYQYRYLQTNPYETVVDSGGYLEVLPVNPAYIYVPTYNPLFVFAPPAPGFFVGSALRFGPAIVVGPAFAPGDGGIRTLGGALTPSLSTTRPGAGVGRTGPTTTIRTRARGLRGLDLAWSITSSGDAKEQAPSSSTAAGRRSEISRPRSQSVKCV